MGRAARRRQPAESAEQAGKAVGADGGDGVGATGSARAGRQVRARSAPWLVLGLTAAVVVVAVAIGAVVVAGQQRSLEKQRNEVAAVQVLKSLMPMESLYAKRMYHYAASAAAMQKLGMFFDPAIADAFVDQGGNGDRAQARPYYGYEFQFLLGDAADRPQHFRLDPQDPGAGVRCFGAIARPVVGAQPGRFQYLLLADGVVLEHATGAGDPFLLKWLPSRETLEATGWTVVK